MRYFRNCFILILLLLIFLSIGSTSAADLSDVNATAINLDSSFDESIELQVDDPVYGEESEIIEVEDWDELKYYSSLSDNDYTLKLKENTNYYPDDVTDSGNQIVFNNNVTILGAAGAYIGDTSPSARAITYTAMKVPDGNGVGITFNGVEFKWIATRYQPDGVFLQMGGDSVNYFRGCYFHNITTDLGHSSILHIKLGDAVMENCTVINCTTDFGTLSVYNPNDDPKGLCVLARMNVTECYFEGNYAKTEPGCINNCGILIVKNSTFHKNSAFWWAGAIHTHGGANTTIYDSNFTDNLAGWNGGALYTYSYLQIYNSRFIGNNCTTNNGGGAIGASNYLHSPYIRIEKCLFENNENLCWSEGGESTTGTGRGGAISLMDDGGLEVYNSTFIKNSASIGTAICAIAQAQHGSPNVRIIGNEFINHTRSGDVLNVRVFAGSIVEISDNYYLNNSIEFSKLKLTCDDPVNGVVDLHLDVTLKNSDSYDSDILEKSSYDVYVDDVYTTTVNSTDFSLNLGEGNTANVYVVPTISNSRSNTVKAGMTKEYIYVSQKRGNDANTGLTRSQPVKTLNKSIELARSTENIVIIDGTFKETNLVIDYNLTIEAESGVTISSTGFIFKITDGDVEFKNLVFKNCKKSSSAKDRLIEQTSKGFLILDGCVFENNEYNIHIVANGILEGENLRFSNNKNGGVIQSQSTSIKSSVFENNLATYSLAKGLVVSKEISSTKPGKFEFENVVFTNNEVSEGCVGTYGGTPCVINCTFIGNKVSKTSDKSSAIFHKSGSLTVQSSTFINNTDIGQYSSVIFIAGGDTLVKDSIFINNSYENSNNVIINGQSDNYLKKLKANNNWWGNTGDNLTKPALKVFSDNDPAQYWLVLTATSPSNVVQVGERVAVQLFFMQTDNYENLEEYDALYLPTFNLALTAVNGSVSNNRVTVKNGLASTYFTFTQESDAALVGTLSGVNITYPFYSSKLVPQMNVSASDITIGEDAIVIVDLGSDVTGNLTLNFANTSETVTITNPNMIFNIPNLSLGNYTAEVKYSGDENYQTLSKSVDFNVNKLNSTINISAGDIVVNEDVVFTITVTEGATGNIDVYVNGKKETIAVGDSYTIQSIELGDYVVRAVYTGDSYYLSSEAVYEFSVAKQTPDMTVTVSDIVYGEDTVVNVCLNSDATGNVTVSVDGISYSASLIAGEATISISGVNAGDNKSVSVVYPGDDIYENASSTVAYNVAKANSTVNISVGDIAVNEDVVLTITVTSGATGSIIVYVNDVNETISVGDSYVIESINPGDYAVRAVYTGDLNYLSGEDVCEFSVAELIPDMTVTVSDIVYGEDTVVNICLNSDATGNVTVSVDGISYSATLIKGKTTVSISGVNAGDNKTVSVFYPGDGVYTNVSCVVVYNVAKAVPDMTVEVSDIVYGDDLIVSVQMPSDVSRRPSVTVEGESKYVTLKNGTGSVKFSGLGVGTHIIEVSYGGDNNYQKAYLNATVKVKKATPQIKVTANAIAYGEDLTVEVQMPSDVTRRANVVIDGNITKAVSLKDGAGSVKFSGLGVGTHSIEVSYNGDDNYLKASANKTVKVNRGTPEIKITGSSNNDELTVTVQMPSDVSRRVSVTLGETTKTVSLNDGVASVKFTGLAPGSYNVQASYAGDNNYLKTSVNKTVKVSRYAPEIKVTAKSVRYGDDLTVEVQMPADVTRRVTLTIANQTKTVSLNDGKATVKFSGLAVGSYNLEVSYGGDANYLKASLNKTVKISKAVPDIQITANDIKVGQTLNVAVQLPSDVTRRATVSVEDQTKTVTLKDGAANVKFTGLEAGSHVVKVSYGGDSNYKASENSKTINVK